LACATEDAVLQKLEQRFTMGQLSPKSEANVLQDAIRSFRWFKVSLVELVNEEVVERLVPLTSITGTL
jgi:hypothetical protein